MEKIISITFDSERNVLIGLGEKGCIYESVYYSNIGEYGIWLKAKDNKNMEEKDIKIREAVAQFTGFYKCFNGANINDLCISMGLTVEEFKKIEKEESLNFLPADLYNEIIDYINKL